MNATRKQTRKQAIFRPHAQPQTRKQNSRQSFSREGNASKAPSLLSLLCLLSFLCLRSLRRTAGAEFSGRISVCG